MKGAKKDTLSFLKAAIGKQMLPTPSEPTTPAKEPDPSAPAEKQAARPARRERKTAAASKAHLRSGRGVQFYLDDSDRKYIRNLAVWLGSQDRRVSDSQVVKAAVRFTSISPGARLLEICDEVIGQDRRRQTQKSSKNSGRS